MKIKVIGSTKPGYVMSVEEALDFSGKAAGICYLPNSFDELQNEDKEKTVRRIKSNIESGHHSVLGHPQYNFILEDVPKILAMFLNNEKVFNTSEKSARYTIMKTESNESILYKKWIEIFKKEILKCYPTYKETKIQKLAQENARYLISVFTPATVMEYSVNFAQLNYIIYWANEYIENAGNTLFEIKMKEVFREFLQAFSKFKVEGLNPKVKGRKFSLIAERKRKEEFGENYCVNYKASFAELAQAQRHRTILYEMIIPEKKEFYVPLIIKGTEFEKEWIKDISSLENNFPQGMLVEINERGTVENFVLKCMERLCGAAQLEIMEQTKELMNRYIENTKADVEIQKYLLKYANGARCTFPGWKCTAPCIFGAKNALTRKI